MSNLSSQQFKDYRLHYVSDDGFGNHLIEAHHETNGHVGLLEWDKETGRIGNVDVVERHRRQGLATAMFHMAEDISEGKIHHSPVRTPEGDAWARAVSGRVTSAKGRDRQ